MPTNLRSPELGEASYGLAGRGGSAGARCAKADWRASEGRQGPQKILSATSMSDITVTLPDGSSRVVPAGTTPADIAASISPGSPVRRWRRSSTAGWSMCRIRLDADAAVRVVTSSSPEALALYRHSTAHLLAAAVTNLFPGTQCGIGPATDEGFFYDFVVERPFVPEDLEAIEKKMKELAAQDLPFERQMCRATRRASSSPRARRAAEGPADRREDRGSGRGLLLHDQGSRHVRRLLRRPARAEHRQVEGLQAAEHVERLLEGRRAQSADAARLRHGLLQRERTEGAPEPHRGSEEARPPQARARSSACSRSIRGRPVRRSGWTRGRRSTTSSRTTCARCSSPPATSR